MRIKQITLLLPVILCLALPLAAQQTTVYTEANRHYKQGVDFYEQGLFGEAKQEFERAVTLLQPVNEADAAMLRTRAEFHYAKSAIMLDQPDAEKLITSFIRKYRPDPITDQALLEVANYYFDQG